MNWLAFKCVALGILGILRPVNTYFELGIEVHFFVKVYYFRVLA
ncbi:MAG: hypothetical protein K0Q50_2549 [Vampirovibrio sp.]|jgi:hypothetical protein|nr:hypothetical protein [Vampirovibrio sp.]